jgi:hypothetical protein
MDLWNVNILPQYYMASQARITRIFIAVKTPNLAYEGVSKSLRTGHLERELHMVQLCVTRCSCIAIWSFAAVTLSVASQRVIPKERVYFFSDSVRKLLDTPSYGALRHMECSSSSLAHSGINISRNKTSGIIFTLFTIHAFLLITLNYQIL